MKTQLMRAGRWAAWLLLDVCLPGEQADTLPSRGALICLTRSVQQEQVDHFWSEPGRVGVVPAVETSLFRIALRRWWGTPVTLWRTEVRVQVWVGGVVTLQRDRAFADTDAARRDFAAHRDRLRQTLVGRSHYWADLHKADELTTGISHDLATSSPEGVTSSDQAEVRRRPDGNRQPGDSIASAVSAATASRHDLNWLKRATQALADHHGLGLDAGNDDAPRFGPEGVAT